jgi:3-phenylpropionate/trans-cinnamate dioxygenase ferredoxin reductase component
MSDVSSDQHDYVIIGGGMAADAAARGIREHDARGTILVLSADADEPYARPALSKKLWTDPDFTEEQVPLGTAADTGAEIRLRTRATAIDRTRRRVAVAGAGEVGYGRLLLATGSTPREIDAPDSDRVLFFRSAADYRRLRALAQKGAHIAVIGGGYIGAELAAALAHEGVEVELVFPGDVLGGDVFPPELAARYEALFADAGVRLHRGRRAERAAADGADGIALTLDDGTVLRADAAAIGLGADPVIDLAEAAGLETDDGVVVDARLRTSDPHIWAAGDIASYPDAILGRTRVEHVDHATASGAAAGRSMAGDDGPYRHTPFFYSAVFGVRWEAVGTLDPRLDTVTLDVGGSRVVVYVDAAGAPAGVLLWDVDEDDDAGRDAARGVLSDGVREPAMLRERFAFLAG